MDLLTSTIQPYAWGHTEFIAHLQNRTPTGEPEAELWMGAHPKAPSTLASSGVGLDTAIDAALDGQLGPAAAFGRLPFLAKVLAAAEPLSIQTHPDLARARAGFDRENQAGVPLDSPTRTYRDDNHKPELICALTPFHAKCGFRDLDATRTLLADLADQDRSSLAALIAHLDTPGNPADVLGATLAWILGRDRHEAAALTNAVAAAAAATVEAGTSPWETECIWTGRLAALYPGDPGVVVALLLNHLVLEPGQAVFLEAGVLHAYMQGAGVEVMANSDNVIRGGCTPKHVDVAELAAVVDCTPIDPPVQIPAGPVHTYSSPVPEFSLTRIVTDHGWSGEVTGPEIVVATEGNFRLEAGDTSLEIDPGQPVWIAASDAEWSATGAGTLFRTTVPT